MKTIKLSDEDYKDLIEMINEIKTQENDSRPNPRMWTVNSTHTRVSSKGYDNSYPIVYSPTEDEHIKLDYLESNLLRYIDDNTTSMDDLKNMNDLFDDIAYLGYDGKLFFEWLEENEYKTIEDVKCLLSGGCIDSLKTFLEEKADELCIEIVYDCEFEKSEVNASFFEDDAKTYIEYNRHNLAKNPHTHAFTVYDMPKMKRLFEILNNIGEN